MDTAEALVEESDAGFFVAELENLLNVEAKGALLKLTRQGRLHREQITGRYLYCSHGSARRKLQVRARRVLEAGSLRAGRIPHVDVLPDELKASIVLFFSLLDEKQRRLYAGLESLKIGHGGDRAIAELLGIGVGTIARGRRELLVRDVEPERIRRTGAERKPVEKNTGGHHEHRRADKARDGRGPHERAEVDPPNNGEDRRGAALYADRRQPTNRCQAAHRDGLLTTCQ